MKPKIIRCGIVSLLLLFVAGAAFAEEKETARLPYLQIYKMQMVQAKWKRTQPDFRVTIRMSSTFTNVKTSDLKVSIDAKSGSIPVKLESDGVFNIPMQDGLRDENPWIVVNQPRGTMALQWNVEFATLPQMKNQMSIRRLFDPLLDAEDLQEEMLRAFPGATRLTFGGLKLTFPPAKDAAVIIHARDGDQTLKLDSENAVIVKRDPEWLQQNAEISLPALPTKIEFAVRKAEEK